MAYNSSIIFGAFALFLAFGYFSVLRSVARLYFPSSSNKQALASAFRDSRVLANFGSSALFISIPSTSLLLFWGWAPALLWLLTAHLLLDSILHLQVSTAERIISPPSEHATSNPMIGTLQRALLAGFYGLLTAIALSFLANLFDRQSGLIFALICLLPAHQLLQKGGTSSLQHSLSILLAGGVIMLGVIFAHQLGFAIYGEWQPLQFLPVKHLDWLALNNQTIIAACLLIGCGELSRGTNFERHFATFTGALLVLASLYLVGKFVLLQATLDAPLNALNATPVSDPTNLASSTPSFFLISLILFWSLGGLLLRLTHEREHANSVGDISSRFGRLQWESVLQLLFSLTLLLSLAAAVGIGAWNSHYLGSSLDQDLVKHFDLAVSSMSALLDSSEQTGSLMNTLLLVGLAFAGFSCLIALMNRLVSPSQAQPLSDNRTDGPRPARGLQMMVVFLLTCYFIKHGVHIQFWVFIGCLAWILFAQHALTACQRVQGLGQSAPNTTFANYVVVSTVVIGFVQCMALVIYWALDGHLLTAVLLQLLIILGISIWWSTLVNVLRNMKQSQQPPQLNVEE